MDSFFSLFDPSDGNQNKQNNKKRHKNENNQDVSRKNPDAPKGRRKGRRSQGKNETLPEESSFLCEPDLSTELLIKDCSYIENYIEVNKNNEDTKDDRKPRRRNSGRKIRRKKNKITPAKDILPNASWQDEIPETLNNQSTIPKNCDEKIGKNVNDLKDIKTTKRKENVTKYEDNGRIYNVFDKLDRVSVKDEMFLSGALDLNLESDFFYSSDDMEELSDDSDSDGDDSGEECYGSLPPEPRFGNVEYKLQLVSPCEKRFQHLVTQLKWRLRSGGGSAVYVIGVRDCGALRGLRAGALRASLRALARMARALGAALLRARATRLAPRRYLAEVCVRKLAESQQSVELRVAVMGANEAGKSTLIGVLTQGELDNGRGSARLNMFRHLHEVKSGRTSSLSHEILGFDAQGNVVNYGCSELMTAERIGERSAKLVSFLDLAGHSKYQHTTLHGLSGYCPHYAMLVISATAGITKITEEHIGLLLALDMPFFAVINKCELKNNIGSIIVRLAQLLEPAKKKPLLITDENSARNCVLPQKSIVETVENENDDKKKDEAGVAGVAGVGGVAVFPVSGVVGVGLAALHAYLLALQPPRTSASSGETCEFQIDEIFNVDVEESRGPVVGGLLARGQLCEGDQLIIGPLKSGKFVPISVRTIYRNRVPCGSVAAGCSASLGLSARPPTLRPGMVLLAAPSAGHAPAGGWRDRPVFGGCPPGQCKGREIKQMVTSSQVEKNRKNARRQNKNILRDIANVQNSLAKETITRNPNIYKENEFETKTSKNEDKVDFDKCICDDLVFLEDPNDPRGCIYFQASVHVLRHSTVISRGFQCSVHVGNVQQTAIIEGIMSPGSAVRAGDAASVLFRFSRRPEYLVRGRRLLLTAGLGTRAIGRVTQTFPYIP